MHAAEQQFGVAAELDNRSATKVVAGELPGPRGHRKSADVPHEPYKCATGPPAPGRHHRPALESQPESPASPPMPLRSRFQLANQPGEDAIRARRLVPYETDAATVAWVLAHNQLAEPAKPTALVRPCRHSRSLGVQTDALTLDTSCLLEDFLRSNRAVGLLNGSTSGNAGASAATLETATSAAAAESAETPEQLRRRCEELAKVNQDLKRLLVSALGLDLQSQLDRLSSERAELAAQLAEATARAAELAEERDRLAIEADVWRCKFTAGRVMIDELAGWRARLHAGYTGASRALDSLLRERQQLRSDLADTFSHLYLLSVSQEPKFSPDQPANTLELAILNRHLSLRLWQAWRDAASKAGRSRAAAAAAATAGVLHRLDNCRECTSGEAAALEALGSAAPNLHADGTGRYSAAYLSPESRACEQLALHSCRGCKGDTFVV